MPTSGRKTIVSDIAGGQAPLKRDMDSNITIEHIWSYYRWYPGFRDMLNLEVDAIFSNGINDDEIIDLTRLMECKEALRWSLMAGYSTTVVDARNPDNPKIEGWHPYIDGIGFTYTEFSPKGTPIEIEIYVNVNQRGEPIHYKVPHYPCETDSDGEYITDRPIPGQYGFFSLRTQGNLRGVQGLPQYLHLMDTFKIQWDIILSYGPFAEKQGLSMPIYYLETNDKFHRNQIKSQMSNQPTTNRYMMMSNEDLVDWVSPQANAYDPFPMLQWLNTLLARATQMNKLMLEGDPAGHLSASETSINNWETKQKEKQAYWRTQFIGTWKALGGNDETNFQDPSKATFISLMEGLKAMREAFDGLVSKQDIIDQFNIYLTNNDQEVQLTLAEEGEWDTNMEGDDDNEQGKEGNEKDSSS